MAEIWAAAAVVVGAYVTADAASSDAEDARDDKKLDSELGFQRQAWLDQQDRKWALEDRKYKEDSIAGFRGFAPESAKTFNGQPVKAPARTDPGAGLLGFDPNKPGSLSSGATGGGADPFLNGDEDGGLLRSARPSSFAPMPGDPRGRMRA